MIQVLLAPTVELAQTIQAAITVEAEYGSTVMEGTVYTAAHHQPAGTKYAGTHVGGTMPSPCNNPTIPELDAGIILVSHLDLDTLGGVARAMGNQFLFQPKFQSFWNLAEYIDTHGLHKLMDCDASEQDKARLLAFEAFLKSSKRVSNTGITDITMIIMDLIRLTERILVGDPVLLEAGKVYQESLDALNEASFVDLYPEGVIVRVHSGFTNHLYNCPNSTIPQKAVVAYNPVSGSITLSLAETIPGISCREIMQILFGDKAGGHQNIAGTPRGQVFGQDDMRQVMGAIRVLLVREGV